MSFFASQIYFNLKLISQIKVNEEILVISYLLLEGYCIKELVKYKKNILIYDLHFQYSFTL